MYHIFEPLPWQQFLTLPLGSSDHWAQLLSSHGCRRRRRRHCLNLSQPRRLKPRRTLFLCQKVKKCYLFWKVIVFNQVSPEISSNDNNVSAKVRCVYCFMITFCFDKTFGKKTTQVFYLVKCSKNRAVFWQIFGWWKDEVQPELIICVFRFIILDKKDKTFVYFNKALFFIY